jgi:putative oxidoreductase
VETLLLVVGKILFASIFVSSGIAHFKAADYMAGYAQSKRIPAPKFAVLASGALLIIAPVLFLLGVAEVLALASLAVFLLVTAFVFHPYWTIQDPGMKQGEQLTFLKELSLAGAILVILALL